MNREELESAIAKTIVLRERAQRAEHSIIQERANIVGTLLSLKHELAALDGPEVRESKGGDIMQSRNSDLRRIITLVNEYSETSVALHGDVCQPQQKGELAKCLDFCFNVDEVLGQGSNVIGFTDDILRSLIHALEYAHEKLAVRTGFNAGLDRLKAALKAGNA